MKRRDFLKYLAATGATLSGSSCVDHLMGYKSSKGLLYDVETKKFTYIANEPFRLPVPTVIQDKVSYEFDIISIMIDKPKGGETVKLAVKGPAGLKKMVGEQIKFKYSTETGVHVKTKVKGFLPLQKITKDRREIDFIDEGVDIDGIMQWCKISKRNRDD